MAEAWALGRTGRVDRSKPQALSEAVRQELSLFGLAVAPDDADEQDIDAVAPCNWQSLMTFLRCDTQWRVGIGFGSMVWIGLDYTACDVVFRRDGLPDQIWDDLRVMEEAALPILNSGDE